MIACWVGGAVLSLLFSSHHQSIFFVAAVYTEPIKCLHLKRKIDYNISQPFEGRF